LQKRCAELTAERAALNVNKALWQQAPRIEALSLQESWIASLDEQIASIEQEIAAASKEQAAELARFGLDGQTLPELSNRAMTALRSAARAVRHSSGEVDQIGQRAEVARQNAQALAEQLEKSLAAHGERELAAALDRRAAELSLLRRRVQADERLEELNRHRSELEDQNHELLERQMLPLWVVLALGGVFMCGVVLLAAGMLMPATITTAPGWALAVLGLAGAGAAAVMKLMLDRSHTQAMENCQRQTEMLQLQLKQAKEDRDELDRQIPRGGGPIATRLQRAEQQLAELEELVPLESRCRGAREEAALAERQSTSADSERSAARRRWREALAAAHLPEKFTPRQLHAWIRHGDRVAQIGRRVAQREEELAQRRSELDGFSAKVLQLLVDAGVETKLDDPLAQLRVLRDAWNAQEERVRRRTELRRQIGKLIRQQTHREETSRRVQQRRRSLLRQAGVRREQELRAMALQAERADSLRRELDILNREIAAAIGGHCDEELIGRQMESQPAAQCESALLELRERITLLDRQFQEHFERRGQLNEQMKTLAADRRLGQRRLDLSVVERRLADILHRWQVLATTSQALDCVRGVYERDRQPETLKEASGYLERLTGGRYRRVWTPLGEHALRVDDEHGEWRNVDQLSRGTREQLLLALRLSLAAAYARRGAALPMVLDDVLVNFDTHRAESAAAVLRDFAAAGHQLLVFTCHEHILRMFQAIDVPSIELGGAPAEKEKAKSEAPARPEPARRRRSRKAAKPEESPEHIAAVEPAAEEPPRVAATLPAEETLVVADPMAIEEELAAAIVAEESPLAVEEAEEDAGFEDSPWEEVADDEDDSFSGDGGVEAA